MSLKAPLCSLKAKCNRTTQRRSEELSKVWNRFPASVGCACQYGKDMTYDCEVTHGLEKAGGDWPASMILFPVQEVRSASRGQRADLGCSLLKDAAICGHLERFEESSWGNSHQS